MLEGAIVGAVSIVALAGVVASTRPVSSVVGALLLRHLWWWVMLLVEGGVVECCWLFCDDVWTGKAVNDWINVFRC